MSFTFSLNPIVNGMRRTRVSLRLYDSDNYAQILASGWLPLFNATDGHLMSRPNGQGLGAGLYHIFTGDVTEPGNATFAQFAYRFQLNVRSLSPEPTPRRRRPRCPSQRRGRCWRSGSPGSARGDY